MNLKVVLTSSLMIGSLLFGSVHFVSAEEIPTPPKDSSFIVNIDSKHLRERLDYINSKIQTVTNKEKLELLNEDKELLEQELSKLNNNSQITPQSLNENVWFASKGASIFNSNSSSHEPDHEARIKVTLANVTSGFDWEGESGSYWYGERPEEAYSIKNTLTFAASGVGISGNLSGVSFSGAASGSSYVVATRKNSIAALNTFDAYSSGSTVKAVFTSSSSMIKTSGASTDSTSSQVTFYDPGY